MRQHPPPPAPRPRAVPQPPQEPILIPKLRIYFADFPYHTFFHQLEALHLGDLMRFAVRPAAAVQPNAIFMGLGVSSRAAPRGRFFRSRRRFAVQDTSATAPTPLKRKANLTLPGSRPAVSHCRIVLPPCSSACWFWNINPNSLSGERSLRGCLHNHTRPNLIT